MEQALTGLFHIQNIPAHKEGPPNNDFFCEQNGPSKGAFTLGVSDSRVESHNTMLAI
jgi:hypothetical protein